MEENLEVMEQEYETGGLAPEGGNEECEDRDDEWEESDTETPEQEKTEKADQPELFTLKNRDETRQVTREQLIAMAQKGWDYDKVRQERDQLRQYRQAMEQVRTTIGGPGRAEGPAGRASTAVPRAETLIQRVKANAQRQDMERFLQVYPTVKAENIPSQVWGQVARGVPLVSAYAMHENQQLKVRLNAQRQDRLNRARTPGSLGGNSGAELDEIDRVWSEDD